MPSANYVLNYFVNNVDYKKLMVTQAQIYRTDLSITFAMAVYTEMMNTELNNE